MPRASPEAFISPVSQSGQPTGPSLPTLRLRPAAAFARGGDDVGAGGVAGDLVACGGLGAYRFEGQVQLGAPGLGSCDVR